MKKLLLAGICSAALSCSAFAAGTSQLVGPDGTTPIGPNNPLPVNGGSLGSSVSQPVHAQISNPSGDITDTNPLSTRVPDGNNLTLGAQNSPPLSGPGVVGPLMGVMRGIWNTLTGTLTTADANNASYSSAGTAVASGTLPLPTMPTGVTTPRGVLASCPLTNFTPANTTLTLAGGGTVPWALYAGTSDTGKAALSATAVSGCTFQALY